MAPNSSSRASSSTRCATRVRAGRTVASLAAASLLTAASLLSCADPADHDGPTILVTIDTLPADRVGCYGCPSVRTPCLDLLARSGLQVVDAISPAPITLPSHATILTGVDPPAHGVRDNGLFRLPDAALSLPEVLPAALPTAAFVGSFPLVERFGLAQGFDVYDDDFAPRRDRRRPPERRADEVFRRAADWLAQLADDGRAFVWTHVFDPHAPYEPPPPWSDAARSLPAGDAFDGEVAFVDRELLRFLRRAGGAERDRRTHVLVTADHGESLGAHHELTHSIFVYDATQRVPLLFVGPGIEPRLETRQRRLLDVAPTILNVYGRGGAATHEGTPLQESASLGSAGDMPIGNPSEEAYVESKYPELMRGWSPLHGIRNGRWKYIRAPRPELYDLRDDPGETRNVHDRHPDVAEDLDERLDDLLARAAATGPGAGAATGPMDAETAARLRSLGYVATIEPGSAVDARRDPKDGIHVVVAISHGQLAYEARDLEAAERLFRRALELDPQEKEAHSFLAGTYYELQRYEESVRHAERSLQLEPHVNEGPVRSTLGEALLALDRPAEALPQLNAALSQRPDDARLARLVEEARKRLR